MGCVLYYILLHGLSGLTKVDLSEMLVFANAFASLVVTHKGALKVMPDKEDIEKLLKTRKTVNAIS